MREQATRLARLARLARSAPGRRRPAGFALPSAGLAGVVIATVLWSGDTATSAAPAPPPQATRVAGVVVMKNVAFSPRATRVKVGQTVTWVNEDRIAHNIVATAGARFDSGLVGGGATFRFRVTAPGAIAYVCTLHQGMIGSLVVSS